MKRRAAEAKAGIEAGVSRAGEALQKVNWMEVADWVGNGLAVAALFGCAACAVGAAVISLGIGIVKLTNKEKESALDNGWWDIAGAATFGATKLARPAVKMASKAGTRVMARFPKGGSHTVAVANKKARKAIAQKVGRFDRAATRFGARSERIDKIYGGYALAKFGTTKLLGVPSLSEM